MVTMHDESNYESSRPGASNEGHSFVVRSDLTQLRCDAWLLPSDVFGHVTNGWLASESLLVVADRFMNGCHRDLPESWRDACRSLPIGARSDADAEHVAYVANIGTSRPDVQWQFA